MVVVLAQAADKSERSEFEQASLVVVNGLWDVIFVVAVITILVLLTHLYPKKEY